MNFKYLFSSKRYVVLDVQHYYDTSFGGNAPSTGYTYFDCFWGKIKNKNKYGIGFLSKENIEKSLNNTF